MKDKKSRRSCGWYFVRLFQTDRTLLVPGLIMIFTLYGFSAAALNTEDENVKFSQYNVKFGEYKVKAAYLYNFAKFVEWPAEVLADPSLPLNVCVYGKDPFGSALDAIKDKTAKGRKLVVKRYSAIEDVKECHILFISQSERQYLSTLLEKIKDKHILTVSDIEDFAHAGGMIHLRKEDGKIRLEINVDAANNTGLTLSSKLLKISKIIKKYDQAKQ